MKLKSFGCSFIFGNDLQDATQEKYSKYTWAALLANKFGLEYECYADPGSGNLRIAEQVIGQLSTNEPALYVINWTWIDRFDYLNAATDEWITITPTDKNSLAKTYYKHLHSQYRDKLTTLIHVKLVLDELLRHNLPFVITYMDDLIFEEHWHTSPAIKELQNFIRPHLTTFENLNFLDWSRKKEFKVSPLWHPLEDAHKAGFEYISTISDIQNKVDRLHLS
jgi:hypothetical protein